MQTRPDPGFHKIVVSDSDGAWASWRRCVAGRRSVMADGPVDWSANAPIVMLTALFLPTFICPTTWR
ncbi:hypothetical protein C9397_03135 [Xanthomonas vasicola pv. vasculorum]|uniref:Uncharacterized protein n=2 Tax=Xanthomonas vasicola pv. vasculorum TaxID=325776 RepID=A0A836P113_XANVA|nr:hypothetical protein C7V42_01255 [Xanthomonas vasicola pv. vasculorum]KEZ98999.1 hypothetical protein A11M_0103295 [Xanthomonas vasicola pv. vasculorum NCPPB 895]KFA07553.1 hypothetical protein KWQ_0115930 [Xanthomonas vasicola pv. musacearum NCPPB 4380]KFA12984.1 hypothetical protein KWM_0102580 [Xanthomonas vasicola pv. musacearum NCPPB 2005]KFA16883.1 hypothetical protein A11G_0116500 [Xanthomonas vasicola pv. musacearum NCPPB 4392]KFA20377.1 hypothetical protein KWU_0115685 [Xanthomonas